LLIFPNSDTIVAPLSQIFSIFASAIRKECKDILLNGLSITTREKRAIQLKLGLPHYGRRLPISVVVCGEPRDLWRMSAPLVFINKTTITMKKICLLITMTLLSFTTYAMSVNIDGISYELELNGMAAKVIGTTKSGNIVIPEYITYDGLEYSVTTIGGRAFWHCSAMTSITIPNSITKIDFDAFLSCTGLSTISIPNSVTYIGDNVFFGCTGLTSIILPNNAFSMGHGVFNGCTSLKSITIPQNMTSIPDYTFQGCTSLSSVNIPNNVQRIGLQAFTGCTSLTDITIGSGVTYIGENSFSRCSKLTNVYCYSEKVPNTEINAFSESSYTEMATLHVPSSLIGTYQTTMPWSRFNNIVSLEGTEPDTPSNPKCSTPIISYDNGQLKLSCSTEAAEFVTEITDADIKRHYNTIISLTATYKISVYATKAGYDNSDIATAILCWIDQEPKTEGITNSVAKINSRAIMIQNSMGVFTIQGLDDGIQVNVYETNGMKAGSAVSKEGVANIVTSLCPGTIAIVKVGQRSVKTIVK